TSRGDDAFPIHWNLGMAAKKIGFEKLLCDPFLARVYDLSLWSDRLNLRDVFGLDRITKNNAHGLDNYLRNEQTLDLLNAYFAGRDAFSSRPEIPNRRASSASTSSKRTS